MMEVQRSLGRIEGKLDALADFMRSHSEHDERRFESIDKQLSGLQHTKWYYSGVAAAISSFVSMIVLWIKGH